MPSFSSQKCMFVTHLRHFKMTKNLSSELWSNLNLPWPFLIVLVRFIIVTHLLKMLQVMVFYDVFVSIKYIYETGTHNKSTVKIWPYKSLILIFGYMLSKLNFRFRPQGALVTGLLHVHIVQCTRTGSMNWSFFLHFFSLLKPFFPMIYCTVLPPIPSIF